MEGEAKSEEDCRSNQDVKQDPVHILSLPAALIGRIWPARRFILGLKVSKHLRRDLLGNGQHSVFRRRCDPISEIVLAEDLRRIPAHNSMQLIWDGKLAPLVGAGRAVGAFGAVRTLKVRNNICRRICVQEEMEGLAMLLQRCTQLSCLELISNLFGVEGAKPLGEGLQKCTTLKSLILCGVNMGPQGAEKIAAALGSCTALTHLSLQRNSIQAAARPLALALQRCIGLRRLYLLDNGLGPEGGKWLGSALGRWQFLVDLDVCHNQLGEAGIQALAAALKGSSSALRRLGSHQNNVGDEAAFRATHTHWGCRSLEVLNVGSNAMGARGMAYLSAALAQCGELTVLNVSQNNLGPEGAATLAEVFPKLPKLTKLNLWDNLLGDAGVAKLRRADGAVSALQDLHLARNGIGPAGFETLAELLAGWPALVVLDLSENDAGDEGVSALAEVLERSHCAELGHLNLSSNAVGSEGAAALAQGLAGRPDMDLDLSANALSDHAEEVALVRAQVGNLEL